MKNVYLILAVLGTVLPYAFFVQHFEAAGLNPLALVAAGFANPGAGGLVIDLVVSSAVFWSYLFANGEGHRAAWLIPLNLLIGLSCVLPLYLYLRVRDREQRAPALGRASGQVG